MLFFILMIFITMKYIISEQRLGRIVNKYLDDLGFTEGNDNQIVRLNVSTGHWYMNRLGIFDEINHVRIDNSERVIYEKTFDLENKEIMRDNTYIILK